jgi:hypothetical protein
MATSVYVSHDKKIIVFWSPKSACSSVVKWFYQGVLEKNDIDNSAYIRLFLYTNGYELKDGVSDLIKNRGYTSVRFVREPSSRSVSTYLNKFYVGAPMMHPEGLSTGWKLEPFAGKFVYGFYRIMDPTWKGKLHGHAQLARWVDRWYDGISFYEYLSFVEHLMSESGDVDSHWDSQIGRDTDFLEVDFLVKVESFVEDLKKVNDALGLKMYIPPKENPTKYLENFVKCADVVDKERSFALLSRKLALGPENLLSTDCLGIIKKIYSEDYYNFNYDIGL